jgi:recombination protein RecA
VIGCKVVKNKVARPFLTASWRFLFQPDGTGKFDAAGSMIEFLLENKLLEGSGGRVKWIDGKSYFKSALAEKVEKEGLMDELAKLLPAHVEPVVAMPDGAEGGWEEPAAA